MRNEPAVEKINLNSQATRDVGQAASTAQLTAQPATRESTGTAHAHVATSGPAAHTDREHDARVRVCPLATRRILHTPPYAHHHRNAPSHENTVDPTPSLQRRLEASRPHTICGRCHQRGSSLSSGSPRTDSPTLSPRSPTSVLTIARRTPYVPPAHRHRHASIATGWRERTETALAAVATHRPPSPRNYDLPPPSPRATSASRERRRIPLRAGGEGEWPRSADGPHSVTSCGAVRRDGVRKLKKGLSRWVPESLAATLLTSSSGTNLSPWMESWMAALAWP